MRHDAIVRAMPNTPAAIGRGITALVGNARVTAGTLGAIVWDRSDGKACMLSNWHVLCGDPACAAPGCFTLASTDGIVGTAVEMPIRAMSPSRLRKGNFTGISSGRRSCFR